MHDDASHHLLEDLLSTFSVRAHIAFRGTACERWSIGGQASGRLAFHLVVSGRCWGRVPDAESPIELGPGALLIYRPSVWHLLSDSADEVRPRAPARIEPLSRTQTGTHVGLLCGWYAGAGTGSPLMEALPPYLLWRDLAVMPPGLAGLMRSLIAIAPDASAGSDKVLSMLCEALLHVILQEPSALPRHQIAILRAGSDPALRRALDAIHASPGKPWTLSALARRAGLSRSTFAQRFAAVAGAPAMTYLRRLRLMRAEQQMSVDGVSESDAARATGFSGAAALRRARRREARNGALRGQR